MSDRREGGGRRSARPRRAATRRRFGAGSISGTQSTSRRALARRSRIALLALAVVAVVVVGAGLRVGGWWVTAKERVVEAAPVPLTDDAPSSPTASAVPSRSSTTTRSQASSSGSSDDTRDGGPEPAKLKIQAHGSGDFREVSSSRPTNRSSGQILRYDVKMEHGLPFDGTEVSRKIQRVLSDDRSWTGEGTVRFVQVSKASSANFTIYLATPDTVDELCAPLLTRGEVSCQNGNRVVLNAKRWAFGAKAYGDDVADYQVYLVNHEVGHRLGHGHVGCSRSGARAPVMMQQTKGLDGCRSNPWPAPDRD